MSVLDRVRNILTRKKEPKLEDYYSKVISLQQEPVITARPEERIIRVTRLEELETLYKTDPLIWGMIGEYVDGIVTDIILEGGTVEDRERLMDWIEEVGLTFILQDIVKDVMIYGNAWLELVPAPKTLGLRIINPKTMDYIRDKITGEVSLLPDGTIEGYIQQTPRDRIEWRKDEIKSRKTVLVKSEVEDLRTRIAHFKLFTFGESYLGLTPLRTAYKSALIRLNIADMIGESAFRGGGILAYVPHNASEQTKKDLENTLKNITRRNIFVFDERIELGNIPIPEVRGQADLVYYFADEVASGMRVPLCLLMLAGRMPRGERELMHISFEMRLKPLQRRLALQVREKIFKKLWEVWKLKTEIPKLIFKERTPMIQLTRTRAIATLARRDLLRRDPELEIRVRREFGLPTKFVEKELDEWMEKGKIPEETKEIEKVKK